MPSFRVRRSTGYQGCFRRASGTVPIHSGSRFAIRFPAASSTAARPADPPALALATRRWMPALPWLLLLITLIPGNTLQAAGPRIVGTRIGFDGVYKVGLWTPLWLTLEASDKPFAGFVDLIVLDGEGIQTNYAVDERLDLAAGEQVTLLRYVKFGRTQRSVSVRLRENDSVIVRLLDAATIPEPQPSHVEVYVAFGADSGLQGAIESIRRRGQDTSQKVVGMITSAAELPDQWFGYAGVKAVILSTSDLRRAQQLTSVHVDALAGWVHMGGHLVLSAGVHGEHLLSENGPLSKLAPGQFDKLDQLGRTDDLEQFASASQRLDTLPGAEEIPFSSLRNVRGIIQSREGTRAGQGPTIVRTPSGFGQIVFVAIDIDQSPLTSWEDRPRLINRLLQNQSQGQRATTAQQVAGRVAHEGFDDMVGQLRGALDQFQGVTLVSFTTVATLTVLYIFLIGPGDYFLLRKLVRRMEWTWITFPLLVIIFCAVAVMLVRGLKSRQMSINQVELVDIDAESSLVRGTVWAHIYSPQTQALDLTYKPEIPAQIESPGLVLSWQGLPGDGLGGMQKSRELSRIRGEDYTILTSDSPRLPTQTQLIGFPIYVASSKSLATRWWSRLTEPVDSDLRVDVRNDTLLGSFRNPLDIELTDCVLTFGRWAYRLNGKLRPGESIDDVRGASSERSLHLHLTRRNVEDTRSTWDPASRDVPRILELMMNHNAVGARGYTQLRNRYQGYTDLSHHLGLDRAILTGWSRQASGHLARDGNSLADDYDRHWTFYRIVFPVVRSD